MIQPPWLPTYICVLDVVHWKQRNDFKIFMKLLEWPKDWLTSDGCLQNRSHKRNKTESVVTRKSEEYRYVVCQHIWRCCVSIGCNANPQQLLIAKFTLWGVLCLKCFYLDKYFCFHILWTNSYLFICLCLYVFYF